MQWFSTWIKQLTVPLNEDVVALQKTVTELQSLVATQGEIIAAMKQDSEALNGEIQKRVLLSDVVSLGQDSQEHGMKIEDLQESIQALEKQLTEMPKQLTAELKQLTPSPAPKRQTKKPVAKEAKKPRVGSHVNSLKELTEVK